MIRKIRTTLCALASVVVGSLGALAQPVALEPADRELLAAYARDTWRSFESLAVPDGLPADGVRLQDGRWSTSASTNPTDIASYLWSTLAAEDLDLIDHADALRRLGQTLDLLSRLERAHGFFLKWYDPWTGATLHRWPNGAPIRPFLSTVDNGWLAVALILVRNTTPELRAEADALLAPMDFGFFYDAYDPADPERHPGLMTGGYWVDDGRYTDFHYGMLNSETRIASYLGVARDRVPPEHYYRMRRAPLEESSGPKAQTRVYLGVPVDEGYRSYRGLRVVPSWDGGMFEALMVALFVPESRWAPRSWGVNHPLYVRAQIEHSRYHNRITYWGVSASTDPDDGYHAFGVAELGAQIDPRRSPGEFERVVTPHATFLALPFAPREALANLRALADDFAIYGPYGFFDSVDIVTGRVSSCILTLDQGMIMVALANAIGRQGLQDSLCDPAMEEVIRPLIALEEFSAGIDEPNRSPDADGTLKADQSSRDFAVQIGSAEITRPPVKVKTERSDPAHELPRDDFTPTDRRSRLEPRPDPTSSPERARRRRASRLVSSTRLRGSSGFGKRRGRPSSRGA